jgi:hypothetical protein
MTALAAGLLAVAALPAVAAAAGTAHSQPGNSGLPGGTWGPAEELKAAPGQSLKSVSVSSISCAAAGYCTAIGTAVAGAGASAAQDGIAVTETDGRWGSVQVIPGLARLNTGDYLQFSSVTCGAAGDCSAGGSYSDGSANVAFVVSQHGGTWGTAGPVTGVTSAGSTTTSQVTGVSCPSAGNCAAVGDYTTDGTQTGFVVSETGGVWGQALEVPGLIPTFNNVGDRSVWL